MTKLLAVIVPVVALAGCAHYAPPTECRDIWTKDNGKVHYCQTGDYVEITPIR